MYNGYPMNSFAYNQQMSFLKGRTVSNVNEAMSAFIEMDGSVTYFPCPADGCIYSKAIDLNGNMVFNTYRLVQEPIQNPIDQQIQTLSARVEELENYVKGMSSNVKSNDSANVRKQS